MELSEDDLLGFREREQGMWISSTRGDPVWMDEMLAPGFTEFGRSGRTFDRETILGEPVPDHIDCEIPLPDFSVRLIEPTVALVTYTSIVIGQASNRSSIWRHDGERWRLEFHQGTAKRRLEPGADAYAAATAAGIRGLDFRTKRKGYEPTAVDSFLGSIADRLEAGEQVRSAELADAAFEVVRDGYNPKHVDAFMTGLAMRLDDQEQ